MVDKNRIKEIIEVAEGNPVVVLSAFETIMFNTIECGDRERINLVGCTLDEAQNHMGILYKALGAMECALQREDRDDEQQ